MADVSAGWTTGRLTVRAPASSANLGPGFDSFGLCLDLADVVSAEIIPSGTSVTVRGEGAETLADDDGHLVVSTMRRMFDAWRLDQPGLRVECRNAIPQGRGLGSSAAAIVAGLLLARGLAGRAAPDVDALQVSSGIEGHADNVASCLLGGLTIAWWAGDRPLAVRLTVDERVDPVVFCAQAELSTTTARGLVPDQVRLRDAAANTAHGALLVVALTERPDLLLPATRDLLHQDARRAAMPESLGLVDRLRAGGVPAVLSGAGPSVLALCTGAQVELAAKELPAGWRLLQPGIDARGARLRRG